MVVAKPMWINVPWVQSEKHTGYSSFRRMTRHNFFKVIIKFVDGGANPVVFLKG